MQQGKTEFRKGKKTNKKTKSINKTKRWLLNNCGLFAPKGATGYKGNVYSRFNRE